MISSRRHAPRELAVVALAVARRLGVALGMAALAPALQVDQADDQRNRGGVDQVLLDRHAADVGKHRPQPSRTGRAGAGGYARAVRLPPALPIAFAVALLAGCGGASRHAATSSGGALQAAASPVARDFPRPNGRNIFQLARSLHGNANIGLATSTATPGSDRLAYGVIGADNAFVYGPSAVYIATSTTAAVQGPYMAPLDSMRVAAPFQSKTVAQDPAAIKGIYETQVQFPRPGTYGILGVVDVNGKLVGSITQTVVRAASAIPDVGQRPPSIHTPTLASVHGDVASIDTRTPPDDMHKVDFAAVLGRRPVALLFATPRLCQSRVCGPVTDIAAQLESRYGGRVAFIHNEVYVDNDVNRGLRPQLRAFHLQTEPWLFVVDRRGRIAARLEGAFGVTAFERAIAAGLR